MMQKYFHFTITCDARRQIPKMILERLVDEYVWQGSESARGTVSVRERAKRVQQLILAEIDRRKGHREFEKLLARICQENLEQSG